MGTDRTLGQLAGAIVRPRHYRALAGMLLAYDHPFEGLSRYLLGWGTYPVSFGIRTPLGRIRPTLYSFHDMLTLNEIFCRGDYRCGPDIHTVVDFGSNIGLSALYFLTRTPDARCYLFEPLPMNIERLRRNLAGFEERFCLQETAVGLQDGEVSFGCEPTGVYGGIGMEKDQLIKDVIRVPCRSANDVLREVLRERGSIDLLKIDIQCLENEVLRAIPEDLLRGIRRVFIEQRYVTNPLPLYSFYQYGSVARFERRRLTN